MVSRTLLALSGVLASTASLVGAQEYGSDCSGTSTVWATTTTTTTCDDPTPTAPPTGKPTGTSTGKDPGSNSTPLNHGQGYTASAPSSVPTDTAGIVDHTFHSWAFPVHFWPDYAGNNSDPNIFSRSIINIISEKTGSTPHFRVGGTSGDRTLYVPDQQVSIITTYGRNGIPSNVSIGPTFYESFNQFPGTQYTYMANLAFNGSNALDNALAETQQAVNSIGQNLESLEIGNEVDLYVNQGVRPSTWDNAGYVSQWLSYAQAITQQVLQGNQFGIDPTHIFQALTYSSPFLQGDWSVSGAFDDGINKNNNVKSVSIHQYMTGRHPGMTLQGSFMNHTEIVANLSGFSPILSYLHEAQPEIPLYLAEDNSDTTTLDMDQYEGVFGSALWLVDYMLYAMTIGVPRVYIQQGTIFGFASWQPVDVNGTAPKVRAPYYGDLFIADTIGHTQGLQAVNLDLESAVMSAYALYGGGQLAKYAVVNLDEWNTTETGSRPSEPVVLSVPDSVSSANVTWLSAAGADADSGISWGGQSYNYSASAPGQVEVTGSPHVDLLQVQSGQLTLNVDASQAALIELNYSGN